MPEDYADYKISNYYIVFVSYLFVVRELVEDWKLQQDRRRTAKCLLTIFTLRVDDYERKGAGYA